MKTDRKKEFDNLSNLSARLTEVEAEFVDNNDGTAKAAHNELVKAVGMCGNSRFGLGMALAEYKPFYVAERGWVVAATVVAKALKCNVKTVFRILADYERTVSVPPEAIAAMETVGLDPATMKNAPIIEILKTMAPSTVKAEPKVSVEHAVKANKEAKTAKRAKIAKPNKPTPTYGSRLLVLPTQEEKERREIRRAISAAIANVPDCRRLEVLQSAFEESMFQDLGWLEPITITFTPHACAFAIREREEQEQDQAA